MRAPNLGAEDPLGDGVFPGFSRRAQGRHDIVATKRPAIAFEPFLNVGTSFARTME